MKKVILLLLACTATYEFSSAQSSPGLITVTQPSPNASSLGKYGEIPVSLYTGIPNISIPIHTFKSRSLELPISLSYHAGGIRVEEISSWVGLGWSLSAGGVITRSVRGKPDDVASGYFTSRATISAFAQKPDYLNYVASPTDLFFTFGNGINTDVSQLEQYLGPTGDSEPDIFYFNFGNYSGKFFMDSNGDFVSIPIQAMKIEYETGTVPSSPGVTRWKITTPDGTQYIFGSSLDNTRNALERNDNGGVLQSNAGWYLLEIISPNSDRIDLFYTPDIYNYKSKSSEVVNVLVGGAHNLPPYEKNIVTNYFQSVKLSRISGQSGDMVFNPSAEQRVDLPGSVSLGSIDLQNPQGAVLKRFKFSYTDFGSGAGSGCPTGNNYCSRLKLDKMEVLSPDGLTSGGKYQFGYNPLPLPSWDPYSEGKNSINSQDLWGFFNGASNTILPHSAVVFYAPTQSITVQGGLRHTDENSMQACVLNEIVYPTGGKTLFQYEANRLYTSTAALGNINVEPVPKSQPFSLFTGDVNKTTDFSVGIPYPDGAPNALVTVAVRQQIQNCPPSPTGVPSCYEMYIERRDGTNRIYLLEGTNTILLPGGDYRIGGSTLPFEATLPPPRYPKNYYCNLSWLETPLLTENPLLESDKIVGGLRIASITNQSNGQTSVKKYLYNNFTNNNSSAVAVNLIPSMADHIGNHANNLTAYYVQIKGTTLIPLTPTQGGVVGYSNVTELNGINGEEGKTEYTFTTSIMGNEYRDEIKYFRPYPPACSYDWRRGLLKKKTVWRNDASIYNKVLEIENDYNFNNSVKTGYGVVVSKDLFGMACSGPGYYVSGYKTVSEFSYQATETTRTYDQNSPTIFSESTKNFTYGIAKAHFQLVNETVNDSQGQLIEISTKYPLDVTLTGEAETARLNMNDKFMLTPVMEKSLNQNLALVSKTTNDYKVFPSGLVLLSAINQQSGTGPLEKRVVVAGYDQYGNPVQQSKQDDLQHSYIWDYNKVFPIAEVSNADSLDIAFTSFEADGKGRWTIPSTNRDIVNYRSGQKSYSLANGAISKSGVLLNKKYVLTFWAKTGASISVNGGAVSPTTSPAINGWQYYETTITGSASVTSVTISGTGTIDELRWYPEGSQMITYTMKPGIGISSITDANNVITYYEYDTVGRLKIIKNDKGEIVKMSSYYYQLK